MPIGPDIFEKNSRSAKEWIESKQDAQAQEVADLIIDQVDNYLAYFTPNENSKQVTVNIDCLSASAKITHLALQKVIAAYIAAGWSDAKFKYVEGATFLAYDKFVLYK